MNKNTHPMKHAPEIKERVLRKLHRNRLLHEVLSEGYLPSGDADLRARLASEIRRHRWAVMTRRCAAAAACLVLAGIFLLNGGSRDDRRSSVAQATAAVQPEATREEPIPRLEILTTREIFAGGSSLALTDTRRPRLEICSDLNGSTSKTALEIISRADTPSALEIIRNPRTPLLFASDSDYEAALRQAIVVPGGKS